MFSKNNVNLKLFDGCVSQRIVVDTNYVSWSCTYLNW